MKLVEILGPSRVIPHLSANTKPEVLRELTHALVDHDPDFPPGSAERVYETLLERERLSSTGIADGVAIPHGKHPGLTSLKAVLGIRRDGLDFAAIDGQPSKIFILLVAPENSAGLHLKALARISRLFKEPALRERVLSAEGADGVFRVISEEDARV
ncbi:MAG: PTS sugar transporter subunit IIA [Myxococcota bacterium]